MPFTLTSNDGREVRQNTQRQGVDPAIMPCGRAQAVGFAIFNVRRSGMILPERTDLRGAFMRCFWFLVLFAALLPEQNPPEGPLDPEKVFAYDASKPIHLTAGKTETVELVRVEEISYDSPKFGRVPGYLVVPGGSGPFAGIVYMHWGQGNRSEWLSEGLEMAKCGALSIMIDAPYWRPEVPAPGTDNRAESERDGYIQMVVDLRRAVDVLTVRNDVDRKRIGYVGHSLGATWGGPLAEVDKRIKMFVLMGGLPSLTNYDDDSFYAEVQRAAMSRDEFKKYAAVIEPYNPEHFVAHTGPARIYFQWASHDMYISKRSAEEYYNAVGGPKEQHWYYTSHEFNDDQSRKDRREWLAKELGLHEASK